MRKALIFTGGKAPEYARYSHEVDSSDIILAADSGYDIALRDSVDVDVLLGDMDSITHKPCANCKVIRFPRDKDYTDTELAISYVHDHIQYGEIVVIGGGEGHLHHTLSMLNLFRQRTHPVRWYTQKECVYFVETSLDLYFSTLQQNISVLGLYDAESLVKSTGLFWDLRSFPICSGHHSVSNRNVDNQVSIELLSGKGVLVSVSY